MRDLITDGTRPGEADLLTRWRQDAAECQAKAEKLRQRLPRQRRPESRLWCEREIAAALAATQDRALRGGGREVVCHG